MMGALAFHGAAELAGEAHDGSSLGADTHGVAVHTLEVRKLVDGGSIELSQGRGAERLHHRECDGVERPSMAFATLKRDSSSAVSSPAATALA